MCEKGTNFVSRCSGFSGLLLEVSRAIEKSFDKSRKRMVLYQNPNLDGVFKFVF